MGTVRILDGGMSRELTRLGAALRQPEWSALALIETPDIVRQVHWEFIDAGADIITTNSYALVPFHIGEERFHSQGPELIALAGRLAREAADAKADRDILVAGSLPPLFGSYEPDRFDPVQAQDYLGILVEGLSPYVDIWLGETLSLIAEGDAVRQAVMQTGKPFWISFTLADDRQTLADGDPRLRSGENVLSAAQWAAGAGAQALLFNCSQPEVMERAVTEARTCFRELNPAVEVGVYANAFKPDEDDGAANEKLHDTREDLSAERYIQFARDWVNAEASIVGGCCGIGASHIRQLAGQFKR